MPYPFKVNPITSKLDMVTNPAEMINHVALLDMPDVTGGNTDHDLRYALQGTFAAIPLPGVPGRRYWCTDILVMLRDTGGAWIEMVRGETVSRLAQLAEKDHASLTNVLPDQHHARSHVITAVGDHTSGATPGQLLQANVNGLPVDATNTDAQVANAVTKFLDKTILDAKGDIITATADDTPAKLTVGADGDLFMADVTAPTGNKWTKTLMADLNFAKFKAIAMACDNGTTLPAAPVAGQWFLHTPTGRKVLYQYGGSSWVTSSIISLGTMYLWVDATDGTDDPNYGYGLDAAAFKTVEYAKSIIPPIFNGNVFIFINGETYAETVTVQGKTPGGAYYIYFYGTSSILQSGIADTDGVTVVNVVGTAATYGILMDAGQFGTDRSNKLLLAATGATSHSGTASSTVANQLVSAGEDFSVSDLGKIVKNTTDGTFAVVTAYISATTLLLNADIFISGENYEIYVTDTRIIDRMCTILSFNSGGATVPTAGKIVKGNTSGARGVVVCYQKNNGTISALDGGSWAGGDADANLVVIRTTGVTGTHTGADLAAVLTDSTKAWAVNSLVGLYLYNATTGAFTTITANTATTITGVLSAGHWSPGDVYTIEIFVNGETLSLYSTSDNLAATTADLCTLNAAEAADADRLAIVGIFLATPSGKPYIVCDWSSVISSVFSYVPTEMQLNTLKVTTIVNATANSIMRIYYSCIDGTTLSVLKGTRAVIYVIASFIRSSVNNSTILAQSTYFYPLASKLVNTGGVYGNVLRTQYSSQVAMYSSYGGCIFDGQGASNKALYLIGLDENSVAEMDGGGSYIRLYNGTKALYITPGSEVFYYSNNQYVDNVSDVFWWLGGDIQYLQIKEWAAAPTAAATYGYLYVDNGTPNDLWWKDDAGNTEQLSAASAALLFLWDKTTHRIVAVQTYATWDTVPIAKDGFIIVLKKQWDLAKYEYKLYPPQIYNPPYQTIVVGQTEDGEPITEQQVIWNSITIDSLGLRDFTTDELPHSMHIAALKSVSLVGGSPRATVIRKWRGVNYEIVDCRVSLIAYEHYQAAKIKVFNPAYAITAPQNADCFVMVYFISETPYDTAIEIPVIVDKVTE